MKKSSNKTIDEYYYQTTKISPKYALTKGTLLNTVAMATSTKKIIRAAKKYLELNFIGLSNIFQ